eukprot:m.101198 g.101198  ORF g.101198 m.101198 type:complete len:371 (+) comp13735_c0_seq1:150-1262(+)
MLLTMYSYSNLCNLQVSMAKQYAIVLFMILVCSKELVQRECYAALIPYINHELTTNHCLEWKCCKHHLCTMHGSSAPTLFFPLHTGGSGYKTLTMINSLAHAYANGFNLGGLLVFPNTLVSHGVNFTRLVGNLFDPELAREILVTPEYNEKEPPEFQLQFKKMHYIVDLKKDGFKVKNAFVYQAPMDINPRDSTFPKQIMQEFHDMFRRSIKSNPIQSLLDNFRGSTVAVHVRRGDMNKKTFEHFIKCSADKHFFKAIKYIRSVIPSADVHVFSSLDNKPHWGSSDFDGFRERNMTVHLDEVSVPQTLQFLALAKVTVVEYMSSFARTAAYLASGCVVNINCGNFKVDMSGATGSFEQDFRMCLQRHTIN